MINAIQKSEKIRVSKPSRCFQHTGRQGMKTEFRKSLAKDLKRQAKVFGDRFQCLRELGIVGLATGQKATTFLIILPKPLVKHYSMSRYQSDAN